MKYEKPAITVERYELTQAIASCGVKICFTDSGCVAGDPHATLEMKYMAIQGWFTYGVNGSAPCAQLVPGGSNENGTCYHSNVGGAFNS